MRNLFSHSDVNSEKSADSAGLLKTWRDYERN